MIARGARRIAWGAFATSLAASACAPALLWSRHTGDRMAGVEVRRKSGQAWLVVSDRNGSARRESARFDEIAFDDAVFAGGGRHFAIAARRGQRWHVLRDLDEGPAWEGVAALTFDGRGDHFAYAAQDRAGWRVVADGVAGPVHEEIGEPIAFSDDGARVGYVAIQMRTADGGRCVRAVTGGVASACWQSVTALAVGCSAATDTYVALDAGEKLVMRGGAPVGRWDDVRELRGGDCGRRWAAVAIAGTEAHALVDGVASESARRIEAIAFAPGGHRLAYAALRDGWRMNVDGVDGERFDSLGSPVFSGDGAHVGYLGDRDGRRWLVIDGAARAATPTAFDLALGPDGRRFAYLTGSAAHPGVVCDGVAYPFSMVIEETVSFSRDGRHWGVLAGDPAERRLFVAVDGRPARRFDTGELFGSVAAAPRDKVTTLLRGWVAAEMEIALVEAGGGR